LGRTIFYGFCGFVDYFGVGSWMNGVGEKVGMEIHLERMRGMVIINTYDIVIINYICVNPKAIFVSALFPSLIILPQYPHPLRSHLITLII
jgi:hypothetical protein